MRQYVIKGAFTIGAECREMYFAGYKKKPKRKALSMWTQRQTLAVRFPSKQQARDNAEIEQASVVRLRKK